jgi:hypothetical protein
MDNSIRKETVKTVVTLDADLYESEFQKEGTQTAQLRQVHTTKSWYPSKKIDSSLQDNIFSMTDFGFEEEAYESVENRVCWINVPENATKDDVEGKLPKDCTLYKILSNHPILTEDQVYAIDNISGIDEDTYANRQVVRYPEGNRKEGQIVLDKNNKPQYRAVFFSAKEVADVDRRTVVADEFYASPDILAEMNQDASVIVGQQL